MSDHLEHNPNDHEDPEIGPTLVVSLASTFGLVALILVLVGLTYQTFDNEREVKVLDVRAGAEVDLAAAQAARLHAEAHKEKRPENPGGAVSLVIPIDDAMDAIIADAGH